MASLAFQKFKAMESKGSKDEPEVIGRGSLSSVSSSSSKYSLQTQEPPPAKKQKRRNFIGDLANRFESEEKKKQELEQRNEFLKSEMERQEKAETERKRLEHERLEQERARLEEERIEMERRQKEEAADKRKEERRKQLQEEDEQYAKMKPAQALFARRTAGRNYHNSSNKENKNLGGSETNNRRIKDMKAKFYQQTENKEADDSKGNFATVKSSDSFKDNENEGTNRDDSFKRSKQTGTDMFCDLYTKGNCNNIKNIFEQNIAVKKGFIPDPTLTMTKDILAQPDLLVVKPDKVKTNASKLAKQFDQNSSERNGSLRSKEYIPINKKSFTHFLDKFEDDRSRQAAKAQLQQLTKEQKQYLSAEAPSWLKKQEDKQKKAIERQEKLLKDEEEKIFLQQEKQRSEYELQQRLEHEAEEKRKQREIEELQERIESEKKELLASKKAAIKAKKEAKRKSKIGLSPPKELPKIVSSTCNDLKKKFDVKKGGKSFQDTTKEDGQRLGGPVVRKIINNPFEKSFDKGECDNVVKRREFPALKQNRIGDIKKRYTMFMTGGSILDDESHESVKDAQSQAHIEPNGDAKSNQENLETHSMELEKMQEKTKKNILSPESFLKTKAFLRMSAEKLTNSKEKLAKASKEKLQEVNGVESGTGTISRKPSKHDMQNYLISKVLFDDSKKPLSVVKQTDIVESPSEKTSDAEDAVLDEEYVKEMQQYLMFIDDDYSTAKKKKKKKEKKKKESKLQIVQVNHIKQQFETKNVVNCNIGAKDNDLDMIACDQGIGRLRERFQFATSSEPKYIDKNERKSHAKPISRTINKDLLRKFDCPERAEVLKIQREKEREERRLKRIAQLEEEKRLDEERREEALRLEQERIEVLRLEKIRIEEEKRLEKEREEEEARMAAAYEEAVRIEKEKAANREIKNLAIKSLREKNEPALRKKKVLGRIQHMFEKNVPDSKEDADKIGKIRSLKGKAEHIFSNDGNSNSAKKSFQDPSLAGVGTVLDKFKGKFEATSDEPLTLSKGVTIKKKDIPSALVFEQKEKEQTHAQQNNSPVRQKNTDWSWKKKDPKELAVQNTIDIHGESTPRKSKAAEREQKKNDQHRELLADIHSINRRLMKKDAIKEHEQKVKEYAEFMSEISNYLNEPDKSASETTFKDDIQNYINVVGSSVVSNRSRHNTNEKKISAQKVKGHTISNNDRTKVKVGIEDIKNKLSESGNTFVKKEREIELSDNNKRNSIKSVKQKLVNQYFSQMNNTTKTDELPKSDFGPISGSESIFKTKDLFENMACDESDVTGDKISTFKKKAINVPSIFTQTNLEKEEVDSIRKSSYEWKYKKKSIQDFQQFIEDNKEFVPTEISQGCANIATNLTKDTKAQVQSNDNVTDKTEERNIEEYNTLMQSLDNYLAAPDKSTKEIDFKSEVERYLDLIEEPEQTSSKNSNPNNETTVVRRPKKLNLSQYPNASRPQSHYENCEQGEATDGVFGNIKPNSKSIKNLQNKLLSETDKLVAKDNLQLHIAGSDQIKKVYEKLNKPETIELFSAPKAQTQKTFAQMKEEVVPDKTLENLKAENPKTDWKWKQKSMRALNTSINMFKNHGINTPAKIEEQHKKLVQTDEFLHSRKISVTSLKDAEEIQKLQDLRDQEIENFLQEMKVYIEKPSSSNKESSLKSGITDYLDLIDDESNSLSNHKRRDNSDEDANKRNKALPKIGQVSNIRQILERDAEDAKRDSGGGINGEENGTDLKKRGRVDASFLRIQENKEAPSDKNSRFIDPVISSVNSSKIKQQLESQHSKDEKEKTLMSAPKRKLKTFEPQQVLETNSSASTKSYLEVRSVEYDYKKYKKLYAEKEPKPKQANTPVQSSYSNIVDDNERKAAILAKFGCKPRPQRCDSESSSSSVSADEYDAEGDEEDNKLDENNIPLHIVQSNAMYAIYGDRLADKKPQKKEKKKTEDSGDAILHMLKAMRQGSTPHNPHSGGPRKPRQDSVDSSDADLSEIIPGSCADMKSKFEERTTNSLGQRAPLPPQRTFHQNNIR